MPHSLKLTYQRLSTPRSLCRLQITVTEASGEDPLFDTNLFVFLERAHNATNGTTVAEFQMIAGVQDLGWLPVGAPDPELPLAERFFRKDTVTLDFDSVALMEQTWSLIQKDLTQLLKLLDWLQTTPTAQELELPEA